VECSRSAVVGVWVRIASVSKFFFLGMFQVAGFELQEL
jgi:hypothetical protein